MARIGITGVPGTGKTTTANVLSDIMNLNVVHVNDIAKEFGIDEYKGSIVVDVKKLEKKLLGIKRDVILEGHLLVNMKLDLDYVFVLRCNPTELRERLASKGWDVDKVLTNVEAECLDYSLVNAESNYHNVYQVDTTGRTPRQTAQRIVEIMRGGKPDSVDWSNDLFNSL